MHEAASDLRRALANFAGKPCHVSSQSLLVYLSSCREKKRLPAVLRWLPIVFSRARADFENLAMAQAFKLHAKVARGITQ